MIPIAEEDLIPASWSGIAKQLLPEWTITISVVDFEVFERPLHGRAMLIGDIGDFEAEIQINLESLGVAWNLKLPSAVVLAGDDILHRFPPVFGDVQEDDDRRPVYLHLWASYR